VKKIARLFKLLLLLGLIFPSLGTDPKISAEEDLRQRMKALREGNLLLEAERRLASKKGSYLVLDLRRNSGEGSAKLAIKNRGIVLRELSLLRYSLRKSKGFVFEPMALAQKGTFFPPKRKEIKPGKTDGAEESSGELDFLELKDMPTSYKLVFSETLFVSVGAAPQDLPSKVFHTVRSVVRHIFHSLVLIWSHIKGKEVAFIEITLAKEDAQALYWSSEIGMNILVIQ